MPMEPNRTKYLLPDRAESILTFWFGTDPTRPVSPERRRIWFGGAPETDRQIRDRFLEDLSRASSGACSEWPRTPRGALAMLLLFDQFPRNIFRGTPEAYAFDPGARKICLEGLSEGIDGDLEIVERAFFYLPLEHSEDLALQDRSVALFQKLLDEAGPDLAETCRGFLDYALRHREIIERFGRFPHRNQVLGRTSTEKEKIFLTQPGSSF